MSMIGTRIQQIAAEHVSQPIQDTIVGLITEGRLGRATTRLIFALEACVENDSLNKDEHKKLLKEIETLAKVHLWQINRSPST